MYRILIIMYNMLTSRSTVLSLSSVPYITI